ncbi:uncharacterized protein ccdc142 isoform X2 [Cyprinodon tularosa]|uniref:uncharacterized protein ccdc142 isoform X2 n=1 Tax=Cyprinodon tularosa TaxID=77115 RepID=UPI0018E21D2C|nr:uncharacterized protein ccdc142 isoform X2 [Cyprinodon tularosa]
MRRPIEVRKRRNLLCVVTDSQSPNGNWPQTSISGSLFHVSSQDEEEEDLVLDHNHVSRSSEQLLTMVSQQCPVGSLPEQYPALWRLMEQRSLLLFIHEFTRRVRLSAAFISRLIHLLQELPLNQVPSSSPSSRTCLVSLIQEFRLHLTHWTCLYSGVAPDPCLRRALLPQTRMLEEMKRTLDLQASKLLVLMDQYVYGVLSVLGSGESDPVLADLLAGAEQFEQAVEEQLSQSKLCRGLPQPFTTSLMKILALRRAETVTTHLELWISEQSCDVSNWVGPVPECSCGVPSITWEQLWQMYRTSSPLQFQKQTFPQVSSLCDKPRPLFSLPPHHHHHQCSQSSQSGLTEPRSSASDPEEPASSQKWTRLAVSGSHHASGLPAPRCDWSSLEPLLQVLLTSVGPLASPRPTAAEPPAGLGPVTGSSVPDAAAHPKSAQDMDGTGADWTEEGKAAEPNDAVSSALLWEQTFRIGTKEGAGTGPVKPGSVGGPQCVQRMDLGQPLLLPDLLEQYQYQLWTFCSKGLWLKVNGTRLHDDQRRLKVLISLTAAMETGLFPEEFRTVLQDFRLNLLVQSALAHWDSVVCRGIGSALKDKCLRSESSSCAADERTTSQTMRHFLQLLPPLLASLGFFLSIRSAPASGLLLPSCVLQRHTAAALLASLQICTVWVESKAQQFLSSWSPERFLLVSQGDLPMLMDSVEQMMDLTKSFLRSLDSEHHPTARSYHQRLLRNQLDALDGAANELKDFSSLVLENFSTDCKRMSGEIFERTMPPAVHWRPGQRTGLPSSPSEYASLAAQAVIGRVLEAPLSEEARVGALSVTMTAFMEAWMEHILRQKIKFSVQGALQLKEDFDSIREMIKSDKYGLSADLVQRLLALRVFQQMDSALFCLLQQPVVKPYLQRRAWEPFTRCCPVKGSRTSLDATEDGTITNLGSVDAEDPVLPPADMSAPAEPYLASSTALGATQQDWLDLRVNSSARHWRLPGLQCLSKTEP